MNFLTGLKVLFDYILSRKDKPQNKKEGIVNKR